MSETLLIYVLYLLTALRIVTFVRPQILERERLRTVNEFVDSIIYAGVAALFLIHFVVRSFYIPSESMTKTLLINDYILVNRVQYFFAKPTRGEIAVFHPPAASYTGDKTDLIKRVVGIEGDVLEVKGGFLWRNGQKIEEPWVGESIDGDFGPHTVAKGCCFMMGDNRNNSADSRVFKDVPLENYVGRAEVIFWPLKRAGRLH